VTPMQSGSRIDDLYRAVSRRPAARVFGVALAGVAVLALAWWLSPFLDKHEGTAAWIQAAGAILIIGATAWIASHSSREAEKREQIAKRQLWESIAALARGCLAAVDALLRNYPPSGSSDPRGNFLRRYAPSDFDVPMDGLAAVPLHQIGDTELITAVLTLRGVMGRIKKNLDDISHNPVLSQTLESVSNQRTSAFNAVASVLRIVKGRSAETEKEISRLAALL
jgi:hypothetical protein